MAKCCFHSNRMEGGGGGGKCIKESFKFEELSAGNDIFRYKLYIFLGKFTPKERMPVILSCLACKMIFCPGKSGIVSNT